MGLDLSRLEKVKRRGSNVIARCPACAESGGDRKGEHLLINNSGQFGCVLFPGQSGQQHRQRIFELAGVKETPGKVFEIRKPPSPASRAMVIQKDILGHLGRIQSTHARKIFKSCLSENEHRTQEEPLDAVPSVPDDFDDIGPRPF
jgi:hypothetical protein